MRQNLKEDGAYRRPGFAAPRFRAFPDVRILLLAITASILTAVQARAFPIEPVLCWDASVYDRDGDGYARYTAHKNARLLVPAPSALAMTCPAGWVKARGDCDDTSPLVHPRRSEVSGNLTDDNCDGRIDENTFEYHPSGYQNDVDGFTMKVRVHDPSVVAIWQSPQYGLGYRVEYQELEDTSTTHAQGYRNVDSMELSGSSARTSLRLDGLRAGTVYRARVRFYQIRYLSYPGVSAPLREYSAIGSFSPWYYSSTDAAYTLGRVRTDLVLRGFYEAYLSELGHTGYRGWGKPDGTRYLADMGEWWCSEFYGFLAGRELVGVGHRPNVSSLLVYFATYGSFYPIIDPIQLVGSALRGDYVAMDTNQDGTMNHSALFLAYDPGQNEIWSLDGNASGSSDIGGSYASRRAGNETFVVSRPPNVVRGWGRLRYSMLP